MGKASREIECLNRLDQLTPSFDAILEFLHSEDLLSREDAKAIRSSSEIAKRIQLKLVELSKTNKLQLLEYEWALLPIERIKIMIITNRSSKEFSFNH